MTSANGAASRSRASSRLPTPNHPASIPATGNGSLGNGQPRRAALYLRVSTSGQTTANQRLELEQVASRCGWVIVGVYEDAGVRGTKGRDRRPQFDALCTAMTRRQIDIVMAWSVDRLGRSLQHLVAFISDLRAAGCDLYLHQQALDTSTPSGRALLQMCAVFAEFEASMIRERVHAGLARARQEGKRLGRPQTLPDVEKAILADLNAGAMGIRKIASRHSVGVSVVQRLKSAAST